LRKKPQFIMVFLGFLAHVFATVQIKVFSNRKENMQILIINFIFISKILIINSKFNV